MSLQLGQATGVALPSGQPIGRYVIRDFPEHNRSNLIAVTISRLAAMSGLCEEAPAVCTTTSVGTLQRNAIFGVFINIPQKRIIAVMRKNVTNRTAYLACYHSKVADRFRHV
jgi:hypothetical protein